MYAQRSSAQIEGNKERECQTGHSTHTALLLADTTLPIL